MLDAANGQRILDWADALDGSTYYEILGVAPDADRAAVRDGYHAFARSFHPDAYIAEAEETQAAVRRIFQRGVEAYEILSDASRRAEYDAGVARGQYRLGIPRDPTLHPPPAVARALDELCQTPSARFYARKADKLISEGRLEAGLRELRMALHHETSFNDALAERVQDLEQRLSSDA